MSKEKSKNPKPTQDELDEQMLNEEFDFSRATRGPVVTSTGVKLPVTIRLDGEVIGHFREQAKQLGGKTKYQTLINEALKEYISGRNITELLLSDEFVTSLGEKIKEAK